MSKWQNWHENRQSLENCWKLWAVKGRRIGNKSSIKEAFHMKTDPEMCEWNV